MLIELYVIKNEYNEYYGSRYKGWVKDLTRARIFPKGPSLYSTISGLGNKARKSLVGNVEVIDSEVSNAV